MRKEKGKEFLAKTQRNEGHKVNAEEGTFMRGESGPDFWAWRIRYFERARIFGIVAVPIGIYLKLPLVWGLGLLGIVVSSIKLAGMERKTPSADSKKGFRR